MFMSYYLYKFLKFFVLQTKKLSEYLLLTADIYSNEFVLLNLLVIQ